jgi:uncharacterized membrane protein YhaH (DUF805 family)
MGFLEFRCPYCGRITHLSTEMQPMGKKKQCKGCDKLFSLSEETLVTPQENTHPSKNKDALPAAPKEHVPADHRISQGQPTSDTDPLDASVPEKTRAIIKDNKANPSTSKKSSPPARHEKQPLPKAEPVEEPKKAEEAEEAEEVATSRPTKGKVSRLKSRCIAHRRGRGGDTSPRRGGDVAPKRASRRAARPRGSGGLSFLHKYLTIQGRMARLTFFLAGLSFGLVTSIFLAFLAFLMLKLPDMQVVFMLLSAVLVLANVYIAICTGVQRLHDMDWPGPLLLLYLVPLVGLILALILLFKPGTKGPNSFGEDPLASARRAGHLRRETEAEEE